MSIEKELSPEEKRTEYDSRKHEPIYSISIASTVKLFDFIEQLFVDEKLIKGTREELLKNWKNESKDKNIYLEILYEVDEQIGNEIDSAIYDLEQCFDEAIGETMDQSNMVIMKVFKHLEEIFEYFKAEEQPEFRAEFIFDLTLSDEIIGNSPVLSFPIQEAIMDEFSFWFNKTPIKEAMLKEIESNKKEFRNYLMKLRNEKNVSKNQL